MKRTGKIALKSKPCGVCAGKVTLAEARHDLATDWPAAYHKDAVMVCRRPTQ